jgi:catechol 2,3-dioxygenase-like lactoylglutathione lyase family enzyme
MTTRRLGVFRKKGSRVFPPLSQIGIYVKDLDRSIGRYQGTFGIGPWLILESETEDCMYRGRKSSSQLRIAVAYSGKLQLELIQVLGGDNMYLDTLGGREEGLHHFGFDVDDLERKLAACREAGLEVLQRSCHKRLGITIDTACLDTLDSLGYVVELIQTRFLGLKLKQPPFLVKALAKVQKRFGIP